MEVFSGMVNHITYPPCGSYNFSLLSPFMFKSFNLPLSNKCSLISSRILASTYGCLGTIQKNQMRRALIPSFPAVMRLIAVSRRNLSDFIVPSISSTSSPIAINKLNFSTSVFGALLWLCSSCLDEMHLYIN